MFAGDPPQDATPAVVTQESLAQRLAFDGRHHAVEKSFDLAGIEEREGVRMIEAGDDFDLAGNGVGGSEQLSDTLDGENQAMMCAIKVDRRL